MVGLCLTLLLGVFPLVHAAPLPPAAHATFAAWVKRAFFPALSTEETSSRWDIPAEANAEHGRVAVNLRSGWATGVVDLGEARRQYEIEEPFVLVLAAWTPGDPAPRLTGLAAPLVTAERWRTLWAPVTYADLLRLEELIQDPARPIEETRRLVLRMKNSPPFSQAVIQVNPRIEPTQRQLRCTLRFEDAAALLAPELKSPAAGTPALWGVPYQASPAAKAVEEK